MSTGFATLARLAVAGSLLVLLGACAVGARPLGSDVASTREPSLAVADAWGPLAVIDPTPPIALHAALAVGTIRITDDCVFLEHRGDKTLLIWLAHRTSWDAAARSITFRNVDGSRTTVRDGDPVELGGAGEVPGEAGLAGPEWVSMVDWAASPGPSCPIDGGWRVSEVALDR